MTKEKLLAVLDMSEEKYNFQDDVLEQYNEFYKENGYPPNELHIGSRWLDEFDKIADERLANQKPDIYGITKHWWYMGMRCFREIWSHHVCWTIETAALIAQAEEKK